MEITQSQEKFVSHWRELSFSILLMRSTWDYVMIAWAIEKWKSFFRRKAQDAIESNWVLTPPLRIRVDNNPIDLSMKSWSSTKSDDINHNYYLRAKTNNKSPSDIFALNENSAKSVKQIHSFTFLSEISFQKKEHLLSEIEWEKVKC